MTFFKTLIASLAMVVAFSSASVAGGDIAPVAEPVVVVEPASKDFYVGVNTVIGVTQFTTDNLDWFSLSSVGVQAGYTFYRVEAFETSVEARYSTDVDDIFDTYSVGTFIKPAYNFQTTKAYGLLGYQETNGDTLGSFGGELAYGGGASFDVFKNYSVFADYVYGDDSANEVVTVGLNYKF